MMNMGLPVTSAKVRVLRAIILRVVHFDKLAFLACFCNLDERECTFVGTKALRWAQLA